MLVFNDHFTLEERGKNQFFNWQAHKLWVETFVYGICTVKGHKLLCQDATFFLDIFSRVGLVCVPFYPFLSLARSLFCSHQSPRHLSRL
jgi:hypothetical protein